MSEASGHSEPGEDVALAARLAAGDEDALRELMRSHGPSILGAARRLLWDPALAEEVAHDAFVALWRRPHSFDPTRGSLRALLVGIARKRAIDHLRREATRARARAAFAAETETRPPNDEATDVERSVTLAGALAQLSERQRKAIGLAYFQGLTYREVAVDLGIPEGTAKTRLRDGLLRLRTLLSAPV